MRNNSKSGLRISEILAMLTAFIIVTTSTQLLVSNKNSKSTKTSLGLQTEEQETSIIEETQGVKKIATISRGGNLRRGNDIDAEVSEETTKEPEKIIIEENETQYISIDEITISKSMDLTVRCGISKEDFKELMRNLKPDTTDFFYNNSDTIYDLCEKYELNEIFFCGLIAGESGWKISSGHRAKCNYISMMSKGKLIKYATPKEGLEAAAKLLHTKYLSESGAYYSGKTLANVQKRFCPNSSTWVNLVYGCMKQIVK